MDESIYLLSARKKICARPMPALPSHGNTTQTDISILQDVSRREISPNRHLPVLLGDFTDQLDEISDSSLYGQTFRQLLQAPT